MSFTESLSGKKIGFTYKDLGTEFGTFYNNDLRIGSESTEGEHTVELEDGDVLRIDNPGEKGRDSRAAVIIFREKFDPQWRGKNCP